MRTILLIICMFSIQPILTAEGLGEIPQSVKDAFAEQYPGITDPLWEKRPEGMVATFRDLQGLKKVFFSEAGNWLETRHKLHVDELPLGVIDFIDTHNGEGGVISFAGRVSSPQGTMYRIESEFPQEVVIKILDASGMLLEKQRVSFSTGLSPDGRLLEVTPLPTIHVIGYQPVSREK